MLLLSHSPRPFLGEVLVGKIKSCNQTGLQGSTDAHLTASNPSSVSLKFFDDIFIFGPMLQQPSYLCALRWRLCLTHVNR